jgi:hypothetical protein
MDALSTYLPPHPGLLPKWLLFISLVSLGNSIQSYLSLVGTQEVYAATKSVQPPQVTPLSARTFGTWTAITAIVRFYAAYHITDPVIYQLALWTFGVAWMHFMSEWLVFKTAKWCKGLAGPAIVATGTGVWMLVLWKSYVR